MRKFLIFCLVIICNWSVLAKPKFGTTLPLPGKSLANAKLQADTLMTAYMAASTKNKNCEEMSVINTCVTSPPQNLKMENGRYVSGYWAEKWDINSCGKIIRVPVTFILNKTGTTYSVEVNSVEIIK